MIRNNPKIYALMYDSIVERVSSERNIDISEAKKIVSNMSFGDYHSLVEATMQQPTNSFSTIKATYPNPAQVQQTQDPPPPPTPDNVRANKIAADRTRQSTIQGVDQPNNQMTQNEPDNTTRPGQATGQPQQPNQPMEDITPPSGQTIGPTDSVTANTSQSNNTGQANQTNPAPSNPNIKSIWPGKGSPAQVGMTVGLKGPSGTPVPGQITQVDQAAKGVKVKNPTTGQEEWSNLDALEPYMASGQANQQTPAPQQPALGQPTKTMEEQELSRLLELAGIMETCSAGATGAGSIASAPAAMGTIRRRPEPEGKLKKEYKQTRPAQTIVGDTKPNQASGQLSANLAATGKVSASRTNNGRKKK